MAPPVPSSLKSQELSGNNNHRQSDDDEVMAEEDMEDMEEFEAEEALMMDEEEEAAAAAAGRNKAGGGGRTGRQSAPLPITAGGDFKCSVCDFTTRSRVTLQRHERLTHLKKKVKNLFFLFRGKFTKNSNIFPPVFPLRQVQLRHARESSVHQTRQVSFDADDKM